jgi:hypothetical protein
MKSGNRKSPKVWKFILLAIGTEVEKTGNGKKGVKPFNRKERWF